MTKKIISTSFFFLTFLFFVTAGLTATPAREDRQVKSFTKVSLSVSAEVYLTQDNKTSLTLEGDPETIEHIETYVDNGTLKIKYDQWRMRNYKKVVIRISAPEYEGLYVAGSGDMIARDGIAGDGMDLALSGSGRIHIASLKVGRIEASISGSGDIELGGDDSASSLDVSISGSGSFDASDLPVGNISLRISGSGNARVYATGTLEARISGSGDVYYKGDAQIDARISGSGKVRSY
jgi:hypothetical protein